MGWNRKGRIFDPSEHDWAGSHAQVPTPLVMEDRVRIFYADRCPDNRSFTTYLDLDRNDLGRVIYCHKKPIIGFGEPGTFDDDGVMPGCVLHHKDEVWLYYSGWNRGVTIPYRNSVGIAVSRDGGDTYTRLFDGPVLERCPREPYMAVTPSVMLENELWRMWYVSGLRWTVVAGKYEPVYVIKYCHSQNGVTWERPNHLCIPQNHPNEALSHPSVVKIGGIYHMWYCFRDSMDYRDGAGAYRIGYAKSIDGLNWERLDEANGLGVSGEGWESTMTSYPFVTTFDGRTVMFYNGNGFGRSGFGYAVLEGVS